MTKDEQANDETWYRMLIVKYCVHDSVEVRRRWAEYFEQVLNVAAVREANINVVGNWRMQVMGDLNERAISEAVNEMNCGKAPLRDGFLLECLKKGGMAVLEWRVIDC